MSRRATCFGVEQPRPDRVLIWSRATYSNGGLPRVDVYDTGSGVF